MIRTVAIAPYISETVIRYWPSMPTVPIAASSSHSSPVCASAKNGSSPDRYSEQNIAR